MRIAAKIMCDDEDWEPNRERTSKRRFHPEDFCFILMVDGGSLFGLKFLIIIWYTAQVLYICNLYMGSWRAIYTDIAPRPRLFLPR